MSSEAAAVVRFERVVKTFGATAALRGVSGRIRGAALTLVEGANGSGKSTLLRILGTVAKPTSGRVVYPELGETPTEVRRHVGWLSHEVLAYGDLTGKQNLELTARAHGLDARKAWRRARDRFELGRFAERPLRTNSRGQRQRIALARALIHEPRLVLLDEPTTGLDRAGVRRLHDLVTAEIAAGTAVVLVSHDPGSFADAAHDRVVLERGKIAEPSSVETEDARA